MLAPFRCIHHWDTDAFITEKQFLSLCCFTLEVMGTWNSMPCGKIHWRRLPFSSAFSYVRLSTHQSVVSCRDVALKALKFPWCIGGNNKNQSGASAYLARVRTRLLPQLANVFVTMNSKYSRCLPPTICFEGPNQSCKQPNRRKEGTQTRSDKSIMRSNPCIGIHAGSLCHLITAQVDNCLQKGSIGPHSRNLPRLGSPLKNQDKVAVLIAVCLFWQTLIHWQGPSPSSKLWTLQRDATLVPS